MQSFSKTRSSYIICYILSNFLYLTDIPTLAEEILKRQNNTKLINLNGLWITDPCTDNEAQFGWLDLGIDFAYHKGLISGVTYDILSSETCISGRTKVGDRIRKVDTMECRKAWRIYDMATAGIGFNPERLNDPKLEKKRIRRSDFSCSGRCQIMASVNY